jgi:hypothetical protein
VAATKVADHPVLFLGCVNVKDKRFGRLVVSHFHDIKNQQKRWFCICDCGNTRILRTGDLNYGETNSCGCLQKEIAAKYLNRGGGQRWSGHGEIPGSYWRRLRRGAVKRGISFEIAIKYAWRLFVRQKRKCALSGREIGFKTYGVSQKLSKNTASLDRIDSKKGYVKRNLQWLHKDINRLKNNYSQSEFIAMCKEVAKNQSQNRR